MEGVHLAAVAVALAAPFYAAPDSNAERQARVYERNDRPNAARLMRAMSKIPQAFWFTDGPARDDVRRVVKAAARANRTPILVAYNVPGRDCGGHSAGGARDYARWIDGFAKGIGRRRAVVIVEPDALASGCGARHVRKAVTRLSRLPRTAVYVDAGHSHWQPAARMARRLRNAAIAKADGFALNVSNFRTTHEITEYGTQISRRTNDAHFVIDTSRNGRGPADTWCNPRNRGLGQRPTTDTGHTLIDAFLWIKTPGESDGRCKPGHPPAGRWWPKYALNLARRAVPPL